MVFFVILRAVIGHCNFIGRLRRYVNQIERLVGHCNKGAKLKGVNIISHFLFLFLGNIST
jgi:hypothetical protein